MQMFRHSHFLTFVLISSLLLLPPSLGAKDGRDFAGFYSLAEPIRDGGQMQVTLTLLLFNYSGADIAGAEATIYQSEDKVGALGAFPPVEVWGNKSSVVLRQRFTLSSEEYDTWVAGSGPRLFVVNTDAGGQRWERPVQLSRRPVITR